ncbi:MAG TPA: hypothetical protein PLN85_01710 [archaeon]|nr:hypothetical protein [archaeon]
MINNINYKKEVKNKMISFFVDKEFKQKLKKVSKILEVDESKIIRTALKYYINKIKKNNNILKDKKTNILKVIKVSAEFKNDINKYLNIESRKKSEYIRDAINYYIEKRLKKLNIKNID